MKTVYINCSPKKKFCASSYFLFLQRLFAGGEKVTEKLHTPADYPRILDQLHDAQTVVFGVPLYVDGIPSSVLRFMEAMESFCKENEIHLNVYCIANNGFIEGKQNEPLMQSFEHFCSRAGLTWGGGVGIGGGVMLNVTRILFIINIGLLLLNTVLSIARTGDFFPQDAWAVWVISFVKALSPEKSIPGSWYLHSCSSFSRTFSLLSSPCSREGFSVAGSQGNSRRSNAQENRKL